MNNMKGKILASVFMLVMLAIGIYGYTRAANIPETPLRILYKTNAGKVFFDHQSHLSELGDCTDCHHSYEGEDQPLSCAECHEIGAEESSRAEVLHSQCKDCHETEKKGPVKCEGCHIM